MPAWYSTWHYSYSRNPFQFWLNHNTFFPSTLTSSAGGDFIRHPLQSHQPPPVLTIPSTNQSREWLYDVDTRGILLSNASLLSPRPDSAIYTAVAYIIKLESAGGSYYHWQVRSGCLAQEKRLETKLWSYGFSYYNTSCTPEFEVDYPRV